TRQPYACALPKVDVPMDATTCDVRGASSISSGVLLPDAGADGPSSPFRFAPQHHGAPSLTAHTKRSPGAMSLKRSGPPSAIGAWLSSWLPLPPWPDSLAPQQKA